MASNVNQIIAAHVPVYVRQGLDGLEVWFAFKDLFGRLRQAKTSFPGAKEIPDCLNTSAHAEPPKTTLEEAQRTMRLLGYTVTRSYNVYLSKSQNVFFLIRSDQDDNPSIDAQDFESIRVPDTFDFRS